MLPAIRSTQRVVVRHGWRDRRHVPIVVVGSIGSANGARQGPRRHAFGRGPQGGADADAGPLRRQRRLPLRPAVHRHDRPRPRRRHRRHRRRPGDRRGVGPGVTARRSPRRPHPPARGDDRRDVRHGRRRGRGRRQPWRRLVRRRTADPGDHQDRVRRRVDRLDRRPRAVRAARPRRRCHRDVLGARPADRRELARRAHGADVVALGIRSRGGRRACRWAILFIRVGPDPARQHVAVTAPTTRLAPARGWRSSACSA